MFTCFVCLPASYVSCAAALIYDMSLPPLLLPPLPPLLLPPLPPLLLLLLQVVSALGPVAGRLPDGSFGYIDGMSPERVETQGEQTQHLRI
jgi:hypothetical protein